MAANRFSTRPVYLQLRDKLAERIVKRAWKPGAAIPNETDLAREFGVSAGTIRKALSVMEDERLITRQQGRGTFVNDQSSHDLAHRFMSIRGPDGERMLGDVRSLEIIAAPANEMECARLCLQKPDQVYRIRRVHLIGELPFMLEEASVPATLFPQLEEMGASTDRIVPLAQEYGILIGRAEERISIAAASSQVANALSVPLGSTVVALDRVVRAIGGRPVEWRMAWCELGENYYLAVMD
jgi:GntR family transcriptional regulator